MEQTEYINGVGEVVERHRTPAITPPTNEQEEAYIEKAMRLDKDAEEKRNQGLL
jgi:hypothetical protein